MIKVDQVQVSARVTGQRVKIEDNFGRGQLPPDVVKDLLAKNAETPIVELVIRSCKLVSLPRELGRLAFLHTLDVSNNALTELPIDLVALTNLVRLTLSGNKFKELPVFIGQLPCLLHLQISEMPSLALPHNVARHGTEAICSYLRSSFVELEEKQGELELNMREALNVAKHADICFVVEGELIHAHRLILALRIASPVFETFLASPNREHEIVGVSAETFKRLLKYVYGNGLYDPRNPAEDRPFVRMLDALRITTFGRTHRPLGTSVFMKRHNGMLRHDFLRLFAAVYGGMAPSAAEPPSTQADEGEEKKKMSEQKPGQQESPLGQAESAPGQTKEREADTDGRRRPRKTGRQKRETRAEREMREAEERRAKQELAERLERERQRELEAERDRKEREAAAHERWRVLAEEEKSKRRQAPWAEEEQRKREEEEGIDPGQLLNEDFLRQHDWFADLRVRAGNGLPDLEGEGDSDGNDGPFPCHKFVLCVRSPYFQAKFEGGMADAHDKEIILHEFERDAVAQLLRFVYTDDVCVSPDNAQDLLDLSGQYQLERLRSMVEKFFGDNIDHDNVLSLLHMADHYQAYGLKVFCTSYIFKHRETITTSAEWASWRDEQPELYRQLIRLLNA